MKKFIFALILAVSAAVIIFSIPNSPENVKTRLFFVDSDMLRLLPSDVYIPKASIEKQAQTVLDELIKGRDYNHKIRRTIPDIKNCMSVTVKNNCAYVNISKAMVDHHPEGRQAELLTIYSIVNSLAQIDGIVTVRFTIEGKTQKDFMGFLDMRETFIPDYLI